MDCLKPRRLFALVRLDPTTGAGTSCTMVVGEASFAFAGAPKAAATTGVG